MRLYVTLLFTLLTVATAIALDLGNSPAAKPQGSPAASSPDPAVIRQGGDTIADAFPIPEIPYETTGTTTGYTDDYDEVCPYDGSTAPDAVYSITPAADVEVDIDMFGSTYDTKIYVYDAELNLVACNDDFYPDYVSKLEQVPLAGGALYYLVIDGWNGDSGDYALTITEFVPCLLECPPGGYPEGEPPLVDEYEDEFNGGCNSPEYGVPFQELYGDANGELIFCGRSGWYEYQGGPARDTDWIIVYADDTSEIGVIGDAEHPTYFFEIGFQNCSHLSVIQNIVGGECSEASMTMTYSYPDGSMWFWAGPTTFSAPDGSHPYEYDYVVYFSGLQPSGVAVETRNWSSVKGLFR